MQSSRDLSISFQQLIVAHCSTYNYWNFVVVAVVFVSLYSLPFLCDQVPLLAMSCSFLIAFSPNVSLPYSSSCTAFPKAPFLMFSVALQRNPSWGRFPLPIDIVVSSAKHS